MPNIPRIYRQWYRDTSVSAETIDVYKDHSTYTFRPIPGRHVTKTLTQSEHKQLRALVDREKECWDVDTDTDADYTDEAFNIVLLAF